jgi:two-component system, NtrC family, response regulator AtoC
LLESELFGHEQGAFTGASKTRKGRFEMADGGTIFFDEVGEISQAVQVKLLRVLQEREFERVGGNTPVSVNLRIISATNKDLKAEINRQAFREDLYYRINVFPIALPSLLERQECIIPLAEYFINKFSSVLGKKVSGLTPEAKSSLLHYTWPGNIRELQNAIERAVILAGEKIDSRHLNIESREETSTLREGLLQTSEKELIKRVLGETGGNRKEAARILGISLRTLQYRIKEYGL